AATLGEGDNQSATGTANDAAGNSASATVSPIRIDKTAPTIAGAPTTTPNAAGWYSGDVVIHWTCADSLSGVVACPADATITGSGDGITAGASVMDKAGNTTVATSPAVRIDRTAPTTTTVAPSGWQNAAVTLTLAGADDLSGVAATSSIL